MISSWAEMSRSSGTGRRGARSLRAGESFSPFRHRFLANRLTKRGGAEFVESSAENEIEATHGDFLCVFRYSAFRWNSHSGISAWVFGKMHQWLITQGKISPKINFRRIFCRFVENAHLLIA
jgi:hypothetical protein